MNVLYILFTCFLQSIYFLYNEVTIIYSSRNCPPYKLSSCLSLILIRFKEFSKVFKLFPYLKCAMKTKILLIPFWQKRNDTKHFHTNNK